MQICFESLLYFTYARNVVSLNKFFSKMLIVFWWYICMCSGEKGK